MNNRGDNSTHVYSKKYLVSISSLIVFHKQTHGKKNNTVFLRAQLPRNTRNHLNRFNSTAQSFIFAKENDPTQRHEKGHST